MERSSKDRRFLMIFTKVKEQAFAALNPLKLRSRGSNFEQVRCSRVVPTGFGAMGKTSKAEQSADARSAIGQACPEEASMYNDLINVKAKEDFRAAWATTRSFDFVTRERETIKEKMEKQTKSRIKQECGGESQEAKDMADMHVSRRESEELKDEFTKNIP